MTFFDPIIYSLNFLQHILGIVLVGYVIVECVKAYVCFRHERSCVTRTYLIDTCILFVCVVSAVAWLLVEYFNGLIHIPYPIQIHWVILFGLAILFVQLSIWKDVPVLKTLLLIFLGTMFVHIGIDFAHLSQGYIKQELLLRTALGTVEIFVLYFFVVCYGIEYTKRAKIVCPI